MICIYCGRESSNKIQIQFTKPENVRMLTERFGFNPNEVQITTCVGNEIKKDCVARDVGNKMTDAYEKHTGMKLQELRKMLVENFKDYLTGKFQ